jgi:hypothetical protein
MSDTFADVARDVQQLSRSLRDKHEQATAESIRVLQAEIKAALRFNNSVARPILVNDVQYGDTPMSMKFVDKRVHLPSWAKYLEHGTGIYSDRGFKAPKNPPYAAIREWAHDKPIIPREYETIDAAAGAIAQQIAREGNKAHPFIDPVWDGPFGYQAVIAANEHAQYQALRRHF